MTTDYTLDTENGTTYLKRNDRPLFCPRQEAECYCGDWCPFFTVTLAPNSANIRLLCMSTVYTLVIERVPENGSQV
jgi:hypothetical protein